MVAAISAKVLLLSGLLVLLACTLLGDGVRVLLAVLTESSMASSGVIMVAVVGLGAGWSRLEAGGLSSSKSSTV